LEFHERGAPEPNGRWPPRDSVHVVRGRRTRKLRRGGHVWRPAADGQQRHVGLNRTIQSSVVVHPDWRKDQPGSLQRDVRERTSPKYTGHRDGLWV